MTTAKFRRQLKYQKIVSVVFRKPYLFPAERNSFPEEKSVQGPVEHAKSWYYLMQRTLKFQSIRGL